MKIIYIAGKISGLPASQYVAKFEQAAKAVADQGFEVYNPVQIIKDKYGDAAHTVPWNECMKEVLPYLIKADAVVLLHDWVYSRGAKIEFRTARDLNIPIIESLKDIQFRFENKLY